MKPVKLLEPNPWGLWDIYGNVSEWSASWYGSYTEVPQRDPPGPTDTSRNLRTLRGSIAASGRVVGVPNIRYRHYGFRVVIAKSENH